MKHISSILLLLVSIGLTNCTNEAPPNEEQPETNQELLFRYQLYPTSNMWTFIKLDTQSGKMWTVQYSINGDEYRFEAPLSTVELASDSTNGRFELYPTQNIYNFILLDRSSGNTWQVQWSTEPENNGIIPIK